MKAFLFSRSQNMVRKPLITQGYSLAEE
ncbi:hemolysin III family protein, partial [Klebsiella aerogenes]